MELTLILGISGAGLLFAWYLRWDVLRRDTGTPQMREISDAIKAGAEAFLKRQYRTILYLSFALACLIYILYVFVRAQNEHDPATPAMLGLWTTISFALGALLLIGMAWRRTAVASTIVMSLWLRGGRHNPRFRRLAGQLTVFHAISITLWLLAVVVGTPNGWWLGAVALCVDLSAPLVTARGQDQLPKLSATHLPERFGLFTIIVLGEAVFATAFGISHAARLSSLTWAAGACALRFAGPISRQGASWVQRVPGSTRSRQRPALSPSRAARR